MTDPSTKARGVINAFSGNKRENWEAIVVEALREYGESEYRRGIEKAARYCERVFDEPTIAKEIRALLPSEGK